MAGALGGALAALLTIAACGIGDGEPERSTPSGEAHPPTEATVTVTDRAGQRIIGWGASVVSDTVNDPLAVPNLPAEELRELDRLVFVDAGVNLVRVFGPGYGTQLETGDLRPRRADPRFAFMRRVSSYGVRFMLTGADAPARLKAHGDPDGSTLAPGAEGPYARYLGRLVEFARNRVGVPFDYVAIGNEPENVRSLLRLPPSRAARVYELLVRDLGDARASPELVLGDNTGWAATAEYARAALARPSVRREAAAIASHTYGGTAEEMRAVAALSRGAGIQVWQTEWGTGCPDCPDDDSMEVALEWSRQIAASLTEAEASAWFAFRAVANSGHGPGDALIVRTEGGEDPFYTTKRFDVFRQYSSAAPPGSRRLDAAASGGVLAVAFRRPGRLAVVVSNPAEAEVDLQLDLGSHRGRLTVRTTDAERSFEPVAALEYDADPVRLSLPPESVSTITLG